jgi:hypothetical protein
MCTKAVAAIALVAMLASCQSDPAARRKARLQKAIAAIPKALLTNVVTLESAAELGPDRGNSQTEINLSYAMTAIPDVNASIARQSSGHTLVTTGEGKVFFTVLNQLGPKGTTACQSVEFEEELCEDTGRLPSDSYFQTSTDKEVDDLVKIVTSQTTRRIRERGVLVVRDSGYVAVVNMGSATAPGLLLCSIWSTTEPEFVGVRISYASFDESEQAMRCILRHWKWH